jgi:YVTN family beta-propeller protein
MGNQYSKWLASKHAHAWAVLARPEAKEIAKISGLRQDPEKAPICLGCHQSAYNNEEWEKDDSFWPEAGVQCESCHGPGSEYANLATMKDRDAAMKAGLRLPDKTVCINCHVEKGSHTAVLHTAPVDLDKGLKEIAHPLLKGGSPGGPDAPGLEEADKRPGPKYVGAQSCAKCHRGERMGYQFSIWRRSPHADAWAVLGSDKAKQMQGAGDNPQQNPACLKCHTIISKATLDEGVGCETCHGPGSDYQKDAVMRDPKAAHAAGLREPSLKTCAQCHPGHGKSFDAAAAMKLIAHPRQMAKTATAEPYKTPLNLTVRPDGREVWAALEASDSVAVLDAASKQKVAEIPVGGAPNNIAFSPDSKRAFVANRLSDTISVIDVESRKVVDTIKSGSEPHGLMIDAEGKRLYVANTSSDDIWVIDAQSHKWIKSLSAGKAPWAMALSPDGKQLMISNMQARFAYRESFVSEATALATERATIEQRHVVPGANLMMGVAWHPSGKYALMTINRTKNLVPMTRLMQGWTITNGLAVIWRDGGVDEVLLDQPDMGFSDATNVGVTPDGKYALVTSSGTDRVAVIDLDKLIGMLQAASKEEREKVFPNHVGKSTEFVTRFISTGRSPRGLAINGNRAYVADSLDDDVTVINLKTMEAEGRIDLGGPKSVTLARYGERLFHSANISFRKQFACHSCHPDGHVDGLAYDIEADGIGISPVDNRTLRGILDTAPFKWEGTNPSLKRQCGARLAMFFTRLAPFTDDELTAIDYYITTIERPPNRYRKLGQDFTPAQRRGKQIFERTTRNDGSLIPPTGRCATCHFAPYFTDRQLHDVGTQTEWDRAGKFDVPHLNNIYDSAPYLHNGMAATLEEIWTVYNPNDKHGVTNDLTKDQLNDLIEYIKTL